MLRHFSKKLIATNSITQAELETKRKGNDFSQ
jgi:hypothetical protein